MNTQEYIRRLNRVAKWRTLFAGWQLGTRTKDDPEAAAVRDTREMLIIARVELNALAQLLIRKEVFTQQEWTDTLGDEADHLNQSYAQRFPGVWAEDDGLHMDERAVQTMKGWKN